MLVENSHAEMDPTNDMNERRDAERRWRNEHSTECGLATDTLLPQAGRCSIRARPFALLTFVR